LGLKTTVQEIYFTAKYVGCGLTLNYFFSPWGIWWWSPMPVCC